MSVLLAPLLTFLQTYGYPTLGLAIFIAAVGAPLPITLLLLAAGAFSAQGDFNVLVLAAVAIGAAVLGDCVGYFVGRRWGSYALDWLARSRVGGRFISPDAIDRSQRYFRRRGGWAIFLTRVLISALGSVTNLVAGTEAFPFRAFMLIDLAGEAVGTVMPLAIGFIAGASWEAAGDILGSVTLFTLGLVCVAALAYRLRRDLKRADERRKESVR